MTMRSGGAAVAKKKVPINGTDEWRKPPIVATVRGSAEWKAWLEGLAERRRQTVAGVIDSAVAQLARECGYPDPPKR